VTWLVDPDGPVVAALLADRGGHPYHRKWSGAHWRLVSLVDLGAPAGFAPALSLAERVLHWVASPRRGFRVIEGRVRACASWEGNALGACSRLGLAGDPRVRLLAERLIAWQWPDGGWNCDRRPQADHSSFYESLAPLWGLTEYWLATGAQEARSAAERTAEFFLRHRLFRSDRTGAVINREWLRLHYPLYWHYDILQALRILARLGRLADPRCTGALDLLAAKRQPDGFWHAEGDYWWRGGRNTDVVDWGRRGPNRYITLHAERVLREAGRLSGAP
jgi:hypothetical protein